MKCRTAIFYLQFSQGPAHKWSKMRVEDLAMIVSLLPPCLQELVEIQLEGTVINIGVLEVVSKCS